MRAAARLLRKRGYHGVGIAEFLQEAGAPKGSLYHYFPKGKEQLAVEAVAYAADRFDRALCEIDQHAGTLGEFAQALGDQLGRWQAEAGFDENSPLAVIALEASAAEGALRDACAAGYARWLSRLTEVARRRGMSRPEAEEWSVMALSLFEGAGLLTRATRSSEPLARAATALAQVTGRKTRSRRGHKVW